MTPFDNESFQKKKCSVILLKSKPLWFTGHINLREGKIKIIGTDRTNERVLKLEASQVYELQEYLNKTRGRIVYGPKVNEPERIEQLIIGMEGGRALSGEVAWMKRRLKHPKVRQASQIRASVIAEWTRRYDVRIVQYMSGHKYVSSTERYQATHLEDLKRTAQEVPSLEIVKIKPHYYFYKPNRPSKCQKISPSPTKS